MTSPHTDTNAQALSHLPIGMFVMTAQFEGKRTGVVVRSVQQCAKEPPMLCVAMRKGHWVSPLIRDSHYFGLCKITGTERLLLRKFAEPNRPRDGDPFDCMPIEKLVSGSPILTRSVAVFDCEVVRHLDLEADCEVFIGKILASRVSPSASSPPPRTAFEEDSDLA